MGSRVFLRRNCVRDRTSGIAQPSCGPPSLALDSAPMPGRLLALFPESRSPRVETRPVSARRVSHFLSSRIYRYWAVPSLLFEATCNLGLLLSKRVELGFPAAVRLLNWAPVSRGDTVCEAPLDCPETGLLTGSTIIAGLFRKVC